eukprot:CAMPEP_0184020032 /NCGR_PEP_ID=MMETSP0954-20121128/9115_1 /TAXON_ID=627963 /ORGANISM="Aplanochytrium sp, Strain PBS07" /LENGTH=719 /DNA_ID=CAMNT_0026301831 /DNA_START=87 /DNA_END=2246 /DNA_ORIENTATION=+
MEDRSENEDSFEDGYSSDSEEKQHGDSDDDEDREPLPEDLPDLERASSKDMMSRVMRKLSSNKLLNRHQGERPNYSSHEVAPLNKRKNLLVTESEVSMLYREDKPSKLHNEISNKVKGASCSSLSCSKCCNQRCLKKYVNKYIPITRWLPRYKFKNFPSDLSTGLTLGIILVPQALSYGLLAGLPDYGLYASLMAPCIYAFLGTSIEASLGPYALISILVYDTVGSVVTPDENDQVYIDAVMITSILSGAFLFILGLLRAGFIVNFLSDPVLQSLTTGGAFLIATSQMKHFLGLDIQNASFFETWKLVFVHITDVNLATFILGLFCLGLLALFETLNNQVKVFRKFKLPGPLLCIIVSTLLVALSGIDEKLGIRTLGSIPSGLPQPRIPESFHLFQELLVPAMIIGLVGYSLTMATTKTYSEMRVGKPIVRLRANQELIALGVASSIGGFFLGYPAFASLSRTTIAYNAGAKSQIHTLVSSFVVLLVLLVLTKSLYSLPYACLSAIILFSLRTLFKQFKKLPALFRADGLDCMVWLVTFFSVLVLGIALGLCMGVAASMVALVYSVSYPKAAVMGRLPALPWLFKDIDRFADAQEVDGILVYRFDAALNFANKDWFRYKLRKALRTRSENSSVIVHSVVIDASSMTRIDSSGLKMLQKVRDELLERNTDLILCCCRGALRDALIRYDLTVPRYLSVADGVKYAEGKVTITKKVDEVVIA